MINDRGQIVGLAYDARGGSRGFLLKRGAFRLFGGAPGATYTRALDISNRGRIVGDYGTGAAMGDGRARGRRPDPGRAPQPGMRAGRTWLP